MADTKISELATNTELDDKDFLPCVSSGTTKKVLLSTIRTFFKRTFDTDYAGASHYHRYLSDGTRKINMPDGLKKDGVIALLADLVASGISYDRSSVKLLQSENVQAALDELANKSSTSDGNITKAENAIQNLKTACEGFETDIGALQEHAADTKTNPHKITPALIKAVASDTVGKAGGVAALDSKTGQVPDAQLPAYVSGVTVQFSNGTVQFNIAKSK